MFAPIIKYQKEIIKKTNERRRTKWRNFGLWYQNQQNGEENIGLENIDLENIDSENIDLEK